MSQIITFKGRLLRINPDNSTKIETSMTGGKNWSCIHSSSYPGHFEDLMVNGSQILANTDRGLFFSSDGVNWNKK